MDSRRRSFRVQAYTEIALALAVVVVLNVLAQFISFRFDLTKEKRYTLSAASKNLARGLQDDLFVKIYLDGNELPSGFKRLRNETVDLLREFRIASGGRIGFELENPLTDKDAKTQKTILADFYEKGLQPTNIQRNKGDEQSQMIVVPGATFYYGGKEVHVNLLKSQFGANPEMVLNQSIEALEYEIANALRKCVTLKPGRIAFTTGHGELEEREVADVANELMAYYTVGRLNLNTDDTGFYEQFNLPLDSIPEDSFETAYLRALENKINSYDGLIIAKPRLRFSEFEKFQLDQYIMRGGKVIWLIDPLIAEMDSVARYGTVMTADYDLGLEDMLFRYGVRVNPNLVQDAQCHLIPVLSNLPGAPPQSKLLPWVFFPLVTPVSDHPIARNIDPLWFRFAASIDTLPRQGQNKTILLQSSPLTRLPFNPVRIEMDMVRMKPNPQAFNKGPQPLAVLVEGPFISIFKNRKTEDFDPRLTFKEETDYNRMIVISDGDFIQNQVRKTGEIYPLGYDRYTQQFFGNRKFFVNCVDYLCDNSGLIDVRGKEITLRLLDREKVKAEKAFWQQINLLLPVALIILFGIINARYRRWKYAR